MKTLRLIRGNDEWLVKYDGKRRTLTVEGPAPEAAEIHRWLVTPRPIVDVEGSMLVTSPARKWEYLRQAVETDFYGRFLMRAEFS